MNSTKTNLVHPQTEEIPAPLEIHPSVDPELARGLINAVEYINQHPEEFDMTNPVFADGKGCIICHAERLSDWRRPANFMNWWSLNPRPIDSWLHIFWAGCAGFTNEGRMARVEKFLRTGE